MAENPNDCDCNADCITEIPEGSILPVIPPSQSLIPDTNSLLIQGTLVSQTVTEKQSTSLDTREAASSKSKQVACDLQVEEAVKSTRTTQGGGSTQTTKTPQSLSFQITIPVIHRT